MKRKTYSRLKSRPLRSVGSTIAATAASLMTTNAAIVYVDNLNTSLESQDPGKGGPLVSESVSIDGTPVFTANLQTAGGGAATISMESWQNGFTPYGPDKSPGPALIFTGGASVPGVGTGPALESFDNLTNFYNNLNKGETAFIGFEFNPSGSQPLYGWMEFRIDTKLATNNGYTLTRYAYEDSGAPITAGAIPEPSSTLLITLTGAFGLLRRRRSA